MLTEERLNKVHGSTIDLNKGINTKEDKVMVRKSLNIDEKLEIAKYAFGGD